MKESYTYCIRTGSLKGENGCCPAGKCNTCPNWDFATLYKCDACGKWFDDDDTIVDRGEKQYHTWCTPENS